MKEPVAKEKIKELLKNKKYDELIKLSLIDKRIIGILISLTYDKQSLICWRAIEVIGLITKDIAKSKPEFVRNLIGRLLWTIRDESGGIGWSSPEILGEIVRNSPELFSDVAPVIASFLDEEKLIPGVLRAIGRIGEVRPALLEHVIPDVLLYLHSPNEIFRGLTVWVIGNLNAGKAIDALERLRDDSDRIVFYENGILKEKSIGELAKEAIAKIEKAK